MLSLKLLLISSTALSAAILLKVSFPAVAEFAVYDVPSLYNGLVSWLRPPYLYLVINCIIVTIVASSKLQSMKDDDSPPASLQTIPIIGSVQLHPVAALPVIISQSDYSAAESSRFSGHEVKATEKGSDLGAYDCPDSLQITQSEPPASFSVDASDSGVAYADDATSDKENQYVIQKSSWSTSGIKNSTEGSPSVHVKPPVSARVGHRRNVKSSPEGGRIVLGVSKQRKNKNETLESSWRNITEGRAMCLTRKSDTWEPKTMMSQSPGDGGKLKREASLSQDELNQRVEAFINKFNEEMRLQRQESLNHCTEIIKRGSH